MEVTIHHRCVIIKSQDTASEWEQVVALGMIISDYSTFPLFLRVLQLLICSMCVLVAGKVNEIGVSNGCVTHCLSEAAFHLRDLGDVESLAEYVHS